MAWSLAVVVTAVVVTAAVSLASAEASVAWAEASVAWVEVTLVARGVVSSDARTWPAVTAWPTLTPTVPTVPDTLKLRPAWLTGVIVPTESRVASTVPVPTTAVRYDGVSPGSGSRTAPPPPPARRDPDAKGREPSPSRRHGGRPLATARPGASRPAHLVGGIVARSDRVRHQSILPVREHRRRRDRTHRSRRCNSPRRVGRGRSTGR